MRSLLGRFHRPNARSQSEQLFMLNNLGDGSTLSLDFTTGVLDQRLTFSRAGGGTYVGPDGYIYGIDSATSSSLAIGTGSKSVTLTAIAGINKRFEVGQTVYFSNGANNMRGLVTAYSPSTQVITINATSTSGSGSFTSWFVGNASARFDYDPTTLTPRGLAIEGTATNLVTNSQNITTGNWTVGGNTTLTANTTEVTDPAGGNTATKIDLAASAYCSRAQLVTVLANTAYTFSFWIRGTAGSTQRIYEFGGGDLVPQTILTYTNTGWTRVQVQFTSATITTIFVYVCSKSTSVGSSDVLYVWGAQLELGSGASSYIPTGASTVQRAADTCIASSTGFSSWFTGGTSGTFYADWYGGVRSITSTVRSVLSTSDVTARHLHLQQTAAAGNLKIADFGAANVVTTSNSITSGARTKGAFSFSGGTVNLTLNGGTIATSSSLAFSTAPTWLVVGGTSTDGSTITDGTVVLNGSIRAIKYWPSVLPTATLQSLTA